MTEQVQLQTTPDEREELARLAGVRDGEWYDEVFLRKYGDYINHDDIPFMVAANPQKIAALLADRDALEAECQRLRERAEVAEKAVECIARLSDHEGSEGSGEWHAWAFEQARAALGVVPEPPDDDCAASDEEEKPHNACDCCGKPMIDDTEVGCGTCYPCQAKIAKMAPEPQ